MLRYLLDEHFPTAIADGLRRAGVDAITAAEAGRTSAADADHWRWCLGETRIVFTNDVDYLALHRRGVGHAGIIWSREQKYSIDEMIDLLELLAFMYQPDEFANRLEYL